VKDIKKEMNNVIEKLEKQGVNANSHMDANIDQVGLGDVVEKALQSFGITEEKFKEWFNLKECNCSKRKAWLNNLFSWKASKK
jgi:hypothetical protein